MIPNAIDAKIPKPIDAKTHGLMDYAMGTLQMAAPALLGLSGSAAALSYLFGAKESTASSITDTPVGVKPVMSFKTHGRMEGPMLSTMLLLPMLTGAMRERKARNYFLAMFGVAAASYLLTDFNSRERRRKSTTSPTSRTRSTSSRSTTRPKTNRSRSTTSSNGTRSRSRQTATSH